MKKKIFARVAVLAIALVVAFNVNLNQKREVSLLELANVEALADVKGTKSVEVQEAVISCGRSGGDCWISGGMICFVGEYTYHSCSFSGKQAFHCSTPCKK